ncbi:hypothetical protein [Flavisphingomonas formosensis]|uniref:hypothetical protein n=1 Tax=Flavisphingomonas formosensis TaxID=861534 RepID=UPI0012F82273|nr:hypothetical protein [Sphingomonas formosensis]
MTDTRPYSPALIPAARNLAARGALDKDLAIAFGVPFQTIRAWKQVHPDFAAACRLPPDAADEAVERALFRKATGYDRETERVFLRDGTLVRTTVTEHVPPCDKAATLWLRVRRPERWGPPPPVILRAGDDALSSTEEALRDIEEAAYEAMCAAQDGGPEIDGDDDAMARIDALDPGPGAPVDEGDPLVGVEPRGSPANAVSTFPVRFERSREPVSSVVEKADVETLDFARVGFSTSAEWPKFTLSEVEGLEPNGGDKSTSTRLRWDDGQCAPDRDTLPHRIHPPLPGLTQAIPVNPIDIDPPPPPGPQYDPAFIPLARQLADGGALDRDLARAFGISATTLRQWTLRHTAFGAACRLAPAVADDAVEAALFARAIGYTYMRERVLLTDDGDLLRTESRAELRPSLFAARFWLLRRTDRWSHHCQRLDLDPAEAARLIAETRERVAEYDLHRRHWRTHGCAPPGRAEPAPPDEDWDEAGLIDDDDE